MRVRLPFVATSAVVVAALGAGCATTPAADDPTEFRSDPRQSFITCGVGTKR